MPNVRQGNVDLQECFHGDGANVGSGTCPDCETFLHIIFNTEREEMDLERFEDYQEK